MERFWKTLAYHAPERLRYWVIIRAVAESPTYDPNYQQMAATTYVRALAKAQRKLDNG